MEAAVNLESVYGRMIDSSVSFGRLAVRKVTCHAESLRAHRLHTHVSTHMGIAFWFLFDEIYSRIESLAGCGAYRHGPREGFQVLFLPI